jgi:hypothetical protein
MALRIVEFFGYTPLDSAGKPFADSKICPFVGKNCIKPRHGSCALAATNGKPVITCPYRLYANAYQTLSTVADVAFGLGTTLTQPDVIKSMRASGTLTGKEIAVFGRNWGQELPIPRPQVKGKTQISNFYVDWILARIDVNGELAEFTAVEVQTIDTTGRYGEQADAFFARQAFVDAQGRIGGFSNSGFNWENVSKRILPQLIYKGHVLRKEAKCSKGLFFVCPAAVLERVRDRVGNNLGNYPIGNGTITFHSYELGPVKPPGHHRDLVQSGTFTTTVDQIALAFSAPSNLPDMSVYENSITAALK